MRVRALFRLAAVAVPGLADARLSCSAPRRCTVRLDGELEDARWFELRGAARAPTILLPPPHTIARRLIEAWFSTPESQRK